MSYSWLPACGLLTLASSLFTAQATTYTFTGGGGNSLWTNSSNWNGAIAPYGGGEHTNVRINVNGGTLIYDSSLGGTNTYHQDTGLLRSLSVANAAGVTATFEIQSGQFISKATDSDFIIGNGALNGTMIVSGTGHYQVFSTIANAPGFAIGLDSGGNNNRSAQLIIRDQGIFETNSLSMGGTRQYDYNANSFLTLDGGTLITGQIYEKTETANSNVVLNGGTIQANASNTAFMQGLNSTVISSGGVTFDTAGYNITVAQLLEHDSSGGSIDGGLTKSGAGTLILSNANNNHNGPTRILGGTLQVSGIQNGGVNSYLGASSADASNLVLDGGTLYIQADHTGTNRGFTIGSNGATIRHSNYGSLRFDGLVTGNGPLVLDRDSGNSTDVVLALNNSNNNYTGTTTITERAVVDIRRDGAMGAVGAGNETIVNGRLRIAPGATNGSNLDLNVNESLIFNQNSVLQNHSRNNTLSGGVTLAGNTTVQIDSNTSLTIASGTLSGGGNLTKTGSGELIIRGHNARSGVTTISGGTLTVDRLFQDNGQDSLGTSSGASENLIFNGGTLRASFIDNNVSHRGFTLNAGTQNQLIFDTNGFNSRMEGVITGGGDLTVKLNGGGLTSFTNAGNNFTGKLTVDEGAIFEVRRNSSLGASTGSTEINGGGILRLNPSGVAGSGSNLQVADQIILNTNSRLENTANFNNTLTGGVVANGNTTIQVSAGTLTVDSALSGNGQITKTGNNLLALTQSSSHSGTLQVNAGNLQVGNDASDTLSSQLSIANQAILSGTGRIQGATIMGTLRPGNAGGTELGTLSSNSNVLFGAAATAEFQIGSPSVNLGPNAASALATLSGSLAGGLSDRLDAGSFDVTLNETLVFSILSDTYQPLLGDAFDLIDGNLILNGFDPSSSLILPSLANGLSWDVSRFADLGIVAVVPEPGRASLVVMSSLLMVMHRRRRA